VARGRLAIPLALIAAVVAAEAAVLALRPREGVIAPDPVEASAYFSEADLARARDFRGPQALLGWGVLAVEFGVLAAVAARPPRRLLDARRPVLAAGAAGAALACAVSLAPLPLQLVGRERAKDVGLVTQDLAGFARDLAVSTALGATLTGVGAAAAIGAMRRFPRAWWVAGAALIVGYGAVTVYVWPVVVDPLFNRFQELPAGRTRDDVLALARRAGVDVGQVLVMDASKRTTAANAYVTGLGHTKRVVLYDTLVDDFPADETRLVVAHELAHVHFADIRHGLLFLALVALPGAFAVAVITRRLDRGARPGAQTVPALGLALVLVATPVTWASNQLSRRVEARADSYALELTREPRTFIAFEQRIARRNVADPDPPAWQVFLRGTHPPTIERIGAGVAFSRRARGGS
jgi:STE24 endopeptidase